MQNGLSLCSLHHAAYDRNIIRIKPVREVVDMPLDRQPRAAKNLRELQAEVAVGEENNTQAARSYRTACSMSSRLSS